ncbi:MAG TPA: carbohydrate ABC transporter permease [Actinopolymorphaceae bacterium]|nr:carbohydrate ABC transporter permease [Actinopolymorphaceae bacterium]
MRPRTGSTLAGPQAKKTAVRVAGYVTLTVLSVVTAFPFVWMVLTSLRSSNTVFTEGIIPSRFTFAAYVQVWTQIDIPRHFLISLWITGVTVVAVVFLATLAGYSFAHLEFPAKKSIYLMLLSTMLLPGTAVIVPLFLELKQFSMLDTTQGLILVYVGTNLPFAMFLMRAFFETLPRELRDSARVDGAGEFRIFWSVMCPLVGPGVATLVIFQFMFTWNEFILANTLLQTPEKLPLQPVLFAMQGQYSTNWSLLCAALVISVLPIVIVYVRMQRQFVAGLTMGALKT